MVHPMLSHCCLSCLWHWCIVAKRLDVLGCHLVWREASVQDTLWHGEAGWCHVEQSTWGPSCPLKGHSPQFSVHVCCGQLVWWIKMPLGTDAGLGQATFHYMWTQFPHRTLSMGELGQKGHSRPPLFSRSTLWPNGRPSQQLLSSYVGMSDGLCASQQLCHSTWHHTSRRVYNVMSVTDCFSVDSSDLLLHREYVQQSLCWVLTDPITSVDDRLAWVLGRHLHHSQQAPVMSHVIISHTHTHAICTVMSHTSSFHTPLTVNVWLLQRICYWSRAAIITAEQSVCCYMHVTSCTKSNAQKVSVLKKCKNWRCVNGLKTSVNHDKNLQSKHQVCCVEDSRWKRRQETHQEMRQWTQNFLRRHRTCRPAPMPIERTSWLLLSIYANGSTYTHQT